MKLRVHILNHFTNNLASLAVFALDKSYFGARRIRGKRGGDAADKISVFGLLKRNGKVFVEVVKNCSKESLLPIIQGKILEGSTVNTDGWRGYDRLILNGYTLTIRYTTRTMNLPVANVT